MRIFISICFLIAAIQAAPAQSASTATPESSNIPREMLAAIFPQYDFHGGTMKPWHVKGSYQIYDESGNPTQQGSYEYWQESAKVYRSDWSRADAKRTEWHTADGKAVYTATGDRLFYFEHQLEALLFSLVPNPADLNSSSFEIGPDKFRVKSIEFHCAHIEARDEARDRSFDWRHITGDYCFDPSLPVLRIRRVADSFTVIFDELTRTQNRILARKITIEDDRHKLLVLELNLAEEFPGDHAMLIPPTQAFTLETEKRTQGPFRLKKKIHPLYPAGALAARISGAVLLDVIIGKDGRVSDIKVLDSPSPLLTSAAKDAVAHWRYELVSGQQPQEENAFIEVRFFLGH